MSLRQILTDSFAMNPVTTPGLGVALTAPIISIDASETKRVLYSLPDPAPVYDLDSATFNPETYWIEYVFSDDTGDLHHGCAVEKINDKSWKVAFFFAHVRTQNALEVWQSPLLLDLYPSSDVPGTSANSSWIGGQPEAALADNFWERDTNVLQFAMIMLSRRQNAARPTLH